MRFAVLLFCALFTASCYEGWEYGNQGNSPESPAPEPPPPEKGIFYILYEPFIMDASAIASTLCFPNIGNKQFRANEWAARIAQAGPALASIAEHVVTVQRGVSAADCQRLSTLDNAALDAQPWGNQQRPIQDAKGRRYIHLKVVYWDGDPAVRLNANVKKPDWLAWTNLKAGGFPTRSLHYFVFSGAANGYFSNWRAAVPANQTHNGEVIETVNPTPEGIAARDAIVIRDTAAMVAWVKSQQ